MSGKLFYESAVRNIATVCLSMLKYTADGPGWELTVVCMVWTKIN
jgi:hypothetical protein